MKVILVLSLSLSLFVGSMYAQADTPEIFYRASEKEMLVEVGADFWQYEYHYKADPLFEGSETTYRGLVEYGINESMAFGLDLSHRNFLHLSGLKNPIFYFKGQKKMFFYEAQLSYSPTDTKEFDSLYDGANHINLIAGYALDMGVNFRLKYYLPYDFEYEDDNGELTTDHGRFDLDVTYEKKQGDNLFGASLGTTAVYGSTFDGDTTEGVRFTRIRGFGVFNLKGIDIIPAYHYWSYSGNDDDIEEATLSILELKIRKRF